MHLTFLRSSLWPFPARSTRPRRTSSDPAPRPSPFLSRRTEFARRQPSEPRRGLLRPRSPAPTRVHPARWHATPDYVTPLRPRPSTSTSSSVSPLFLAVRRRCCPLPPVPPATAPPRPRTRPSRPRRPRLSGRPRRVTTTRNPPSQIPRSKTLTLTEPNRVPSVCLSRTPSSPHCGAEGCPACVQIAVCKRPMCTSPWAHDRDCGEDRIHQHSTPQHPIIKLRFSYKIPPENPSTLP